MNKSTVRKVLAAIEKESDFYFTYNSKQINTSREVSIKVRDRLVSEILDELFAGEDVKYTINDKHIVLYREEAAVDRRVSIVQQGKRVTGIVADEQGELVAGANIVEKGTSNGTITGVNGDFSLSVSDDATLIVSFIGFSTQEISVRNKANLRIVLLEDAKALEEVIVLGYGATARKADLSAAIGIVENLEALKNRPVPNASSLLQGQIPGVTVRNSGGNPAEAPTVTIRGIGSKGGESPLWVVDGVPDAPINLNEIESIVVLKDAASAAIYGAYSGSAGVVLVTTKKAKAGTAAVTYEGTFGFSEATHMLQSLTIEEERRVRQMAYDDMGLTLPDGWDPAKNPYISQTRTDWFDAITRQAPFQRHYVSIGGGTESLKNKLSLQIIDQQGVVISTYAKTFNLRYDASYNITKYVRLREDFSWYVWDNRNVVLGGGTQNTFYHTMAMPRNTEVRYADGSWGNLAPPNPEEYAAQYGSTFTDIHAMLFNPVARMTEPNVNQKPSRVMSSTFFEILDPIPGLKFTSRFTYKLDYGFNKNFNPTLYNYSISDLGYATSRTTRWETENTLNYDRSFGDHQLGAYLSTTANEQRGYTLSATARNYDNEEETYQYLNYGDPSTINATDGYWDPDNNVAFVGRLAYSYANRYFATASFRRDYAGRLPKGKKYGDFPGVTAAWKISEESFLPKTETLTLLKLRGSWGRIGNLASLDYAYGNPALSMSSNALRSWLIGADPSNIYPLLIRNENAFNPYLTWETSEQIDIGLDAAFLNDRLTFSADWFLKRTYNLLKGQDSGWPTYIGMNAKKINEGEIRNTGWEFTAGWNDRAGDWTYYVNANLGTLKNWVHDIGPINPETGKKPVWTESDDYRSTLVPQRTREGGPMRSFWLIKTEGLFQSDAEAAAYVDKDGNRIQPNAKAGDLKFIDQLTVDTNGDGVPDAADGKINDDDRVYMDAYYPKVTYGLSGGLAYKQLSLGLLLQGVAGSKVFQAYDRFFLQEADQSYNRWNKILDAWPVTNDVPRISAGDGNGNFTTASDWYLHDASYLRVKNINLAYDLTTLVRKASLMWDRRSTLSVYVSVDNLYTFTKYNGFDPEVGGYGTDVLTYPMQRTWSLGVKVNF
jgi:TonB-linked SusC/RagA family outer membrane protein